MDENFLSSRILATKTQIVALEEAILALTAGAIVSYTLDTGQSRQTVTKADIGVLTKALDSLYNRLATLEARLTGSGVVTMRPLW